MKRKLVRVAAVALVVAGLGLAIAGPDSAGAKDAGIFWCRTCQ